MEDLIVYEDENNQKKTIFCTVQKISVSTITFSTKENIITIPLHRLIKLKQKGGNNE